MAGMGKRMRPHTLTTPKPLLPIAGKSIVQRLAEGIAKVCMEPINEIAFVIGPDFGEKVEKTLLKIAASLGAKGIINYQEEALGTAHAVYSAVQSLNGPVIVAFADTLFRADFKLDTSKDGIIWVQKVDDPRPFGVVKINDDNKITDFVEKPVEFVSDLAIIGIYFFRDGEVLRKEIEYLLDHDIKEKGEYQLTNALENMKNKGMEFIPGKVVEWLDCGNKDATVFTNQRILANTTDEELISPDSEFMNSKIIEPCFIGKGVKLIDSTVGPFVSVGNNTIISNSVISNTIILEHTKIDNATLTNSMIGNHVNYDGKSNQISLSDYSTQINTL
jgi:glucose-1-phosphate thymidylyltransferase